MANNAVSTSETGQSGQTHQNTNLVPADSKRKISSSPNENSLNGNGTKKARLDPAPADDSTLQLNAKDFEMLSKIKEQRTELFRRIQYCKSASQRQIKVLYSNQTAEQNRAEFLEQTKVALNFRVAPSGGSLVGAGNNKSASSVATRKRQSNRQQKNKKYDAFVTQFTENDNGDGNSSSAEEKRPQHLSSSSSSGRNGVLPHTHASAAGYKYNNNQYPTQNNLAEMDTSSAFTPQYLSLIEQRQNLVKKLQDNQNFRDTLRMKKQYVQHLPMRKKSHWDYVMSEMRSMATDFIQERKWKTSTAKALSETFVSSSKVLELQARSFDKSKSIDSNGDDSNFVDQTPDDIQHAKTISRKIHQNLLFRISFLQSEDSWLYKQCGNSYSASPEKQSQDSLDTDFSQLIEELKSKNSSEVKEHACILATESKSSTVIDTKLRELVLESKASGVLVIISPPQSLAKWDLVFRHDGTVKDNDVHIFDPSLDIEWNKTLGKKGSKSWSVLIVELALVHDLLSRYTSDDKFPISCIVVDTTQFGTRHHTFSNTSSYSEGGGCSSHVFTNPQFQSIVWWSKVFLLCDKSSKTCKQKIYLERKSNDIRAKQQGVQLNSHQSLIQVVQLKFLFSEVFQKTTLKEMKRFVSIQSAKSNDIDLGEKIAECVNTCGEDIVNSIQTEIIACPMSESQSKAYTQVCFWVRGALGTPNTNANAVAGALMRLRRVLLHDNLQSILFKYLNISESLDVISRTGGDEFVKDIIESGSAKMKKLGELILKEIETKAPSPSKRSKKKIKTTSKVRRILIICSLPESFLLCSSYLDSCSIVYDHVFECDASAKNGMSSKEHSIHKGLQWVLAQNKLRDFASADPGKGRAIPKESEANFTTKIMIVSPFTLQQIPIHRYCDLLLSFDTDWADNIIPEYHTDTDESYHMKLTNENSIEEKIYASSGDLEEYLLSTREKDLAELLGCPAFPQPYKFLPKGESESPDTLRHFINSLVNLERKVAESLVPPENGLNKNPLTIQPLLPPLPPLYPPRVKFSFIQALLDYRLKLGSDQLLQQNNELNRGLTLGPPADQVMSLMLYENKRTAAHMSACDGPTVWPFHKVVPLDPHEVTSDDIKDDMFPVQLSRICNSERIATSQAQPWLQLDSRFIDDLSLTPYVTQTDGISHPGEDDISLYDSSHIMLALPNREVGYTNPVWLSQNRNALQYQINRYNSIVCQVKNPTVKTSQNPHLLVPSNKHLIQHLELRDRIFNSSISGIRLPMGVQSSSVASGQKREIWVNSHQHSKGNGSTHAIGESFKESEESWLKDHVVISHKQSVSVENKEDKPDNPLASSNSKLNWHFLASALSMEDPQFNENITKCRSARQCMDHYYGMIKGSKKVEELKDTTKTNDISTSKKGSLLKKSLIMKENSAQVAPNIQFIQPHASHATQLQADWPLSFLSKRDAAANKST